MRRSNSKLVGILFGIIAIGAWSQGAIIKDAFNRANTAVASDNVGSIIGNSWSNGSPVTTTSNFRILNNEIDITGTTTPWFLVNTAVGTINDGENNSFTMSGEIKLGVLGNNYAGLVVNYQDSQNYYALRIKGSDGTVQFLRVVNGAIQAFFNQAAAFTTAADHYYRITVSSPSPYNFNINIVDTTTGSLVFSGSATDANQNFKDGLGGFYSSHSVSFFDNFSLEHEQLVQSADSRVADYFNRDDTSIASNNVADIIGDSWSNGSQTAATSTFRILNNEIDITGTTTPWFLVNTAVGTINDGEDNSFTLSGEIKLGVLGNNYAGLVVNYQDSQNYYALRIKGSDGSVQFLRVVNGAISTTLNQAAAFTTAADRYYRITVSSSVPYNFNLSIVDTADGSTVFSSSTTDTLQNFKDGLGGFYSSHSVSFFDNFDLARITPAGLTEDFNRGDTSLDTDFAASVGSGWLSGGNADATSRVFSNAVEVGAVGSGDSGIQLINTSLETLNDGEYTDFALSATVRTDAPDSGSWAGMVFNWQDANNCYLLRYSGGGGVQLLRIVNGSINAILNASDAFTHVADRPYQLTVSSADPHIFDLSIKDTVTDTVVFSATSVSDGNNNFTGGYGGLYAYTADPVHFGFDDYNLAVSQLALPPAGASYEQWAAGFGISGTATDDDDGDGLSNLAEYALGGNPTNALDLGESPVLTVGGIEVSYVFPQRSDDTTLTYTVKTTDDLVDGVWTNTGISVINTNVTGSTLDYVTNSVSADVPQRFIKLEVQQN